MNRMEFIRRAGSTRWQAAALCLLSLLWLQFGSAHLHHSGHEAEKPHVHSLLSAHHADLHPEHAESDIDLTPDAAASSSSQQYLDIALLLTVIAFLLPLVTAAGFGTSPARLPAQTSPLYLSPPLRAPPFRA